MLKNLKALKLIVMNRREFSIEDVRKKLGDHVNAAAIAGIDTIITRNGRPIARITPLETDMTTTTEYGFWSIDNTARVEDYVINALGEYAGDFDVPAMTAEFRDEISDNLPEGVSLHGETVYGPVPMVSPNLSKAVAAVDFWAIAGRHEKRRFEVHTQVRTDAGSWQTLEIEPSTRGEFDQAEVNSNDIGGEPGQELRLLLVDPEEAGDARVVATQEILSV